MPGNTLSILKSNLLKHYLTSKEIDISAVNTVGELWYIIFSNPNYLEWYNELKNSGIFPTQEELAQYHRNDNTNVWSWLASSDARIPIFQTLLDKGVIPLAKDLNLCRSNTNANAWYWLTRNDARIPIFQTLLDKGVIPSAKDLSPCHLSENVNAWFWLASSDARIPIFQALLDKGAIPSAKDLSPCHLSENVNAWFWLASSDAYIPIFQALLDKGAIPSAKELNLCRSSTNANAWYGLARSDARIPIFQALLDKGVIPLAKDLNLCRSNTNVHAWYGLAKHQAHKLLLQLYDLDLIPEDKIEPMHASREHQNIVNKINRHREFLSQVSTNLKIKQNNKIAVLLTRDDVNQFYGFLYLFLGMARKPNASVNLPVEIWYQLGQYLLPSATTFKKFKRLLSDKKKSTFIKYHVTKLIDEYDGTTTFFRRPPHKDRAISLKQAIIENKKSPDKLLYEQYCMSMMPGKTPYKNPSNKHQQAFTHKVTDNDDFLPILKEGKFFRIK